MLLFTVPTSPATDGIIDGRNELVLLDDTSESSIFAGTFGMYDAAAQAAGGFPEFVPNQTNRFCFLRGTATSDAYQPTKTITGSVTVFYWPRYHYIRSRRPGLLITDDDNAHELSNGAASKAAYRTEDRKYLPVLTEPANPRRLAQIRHGA